MRWGDGFEIETLINVRVAALELKVAEVASVEAARLHGVSNLNAIRDGRRVLRTIMQEYRRKRAINAGRVTLRPLPAPVEAARPSLVAPAER